VAVSIRPENVTIEKTDAENTRVPIGEAESILNGRIEQASFQGQTRRYDVTLNGWRAQVLTSPEIRLTPGETVALRLAAHNVTAIPRV
jgi:ABC-type Fe3+/spermidine/putrescine transport system ATPase subunit